MIEAVPKVNGSGEGVTANRPGRVRADFLKMVTLGLSYRISSS